MTIVLVDEEKGWSVPINLDEGMRAALAAQVEVFGADREALGIRWANTIRAGLIQGLDYDLRPPSQAQVTFATAIAQSLGLPLPVEVLRYRRDMHSFLDEHAETYKAKQFPKASKRTQQNTWQSYAAELDDEDVPF